MQSVINTPKNEQLTTQWALNTAMGLGGSQVFIDGTDSSSNIYFAIQTISEVEFTSLDSANATDISKLLSYTLPAGIILYGEFSNIVVSSGLICAYCKE